MAVPSEGWALELCGHQFDLADMRAQLKPPFDPWVEEYDDDGTPRLLLRSLTWVDIESTSEMMADAARLVDHINGVHLIGRSDSDTVSVGRTLRFDKDGTRRGITIELSASLNMRSRIRATLSSGSEPTEDVASLMQNRLMRANTDKITSDLLTFIVRADNWFDLYKCIESIEKLVGNPRKIQQLESSWDSVKQTANCHRHAPNQKKYPLPKHPPDIHQARAVLIKVAGKVL